MDLMNKFLKNNDDSMQMDSSETPVVHSEPVRNYGQISSESIPKERGEGSAPIPHKDGVVPNRMEVRSEQNLPALENLSEKGCHAPACSSEHTTHTLTIRDATRLFYEAGVSRTERAITNWCSPNARGIIRLNCCYNETDRKFYITPLSIDQAIKKEQRRFQVLEFKELPSVDELAADDEGSEQARNNTQTGSERISGIKASGSANILNTSGSSMGQIQNEGCLESGRKDSGFHEAGQQGDQLRELQMENYDLKVQLEGQKYLVKKFDELVAGERERHESEKITLLDRLMDARREFGALEEKLLQLEAPKGVVRETEVLDEFVEE